MSLGLWFCRASHTHGLQLRVIADLDLQGLHSCCLTNVAVKPLKVHILRATLDYFDIMNIIYIYICICLCIYVQEYYIICR